MFVCVVSLSEMVYDKCFCVLSRYLRYCMINVCVCVVSLSQMNEKCLCVSSRYLVMFYVKCVVVSLSDVVSRYLRCCMINVSVISDVV